MFSKLADTIWASGFSFLFTEDSVTPVRGLISLFCETEIKKKPMARKCLPCQAAATSGSVPKAILIAAAVMVAVGLLFTVRETWSGSGSSTRGQGFDENYREGPPWSERQLLLPYPNYELSSQVGGIPSVQRFYVKNRLSSSPYNLYSYRPDLIIPSVGNAPEFRRVGIVFDRERTERKFPLFGRPTYPGGNRFDYYVLDDTMHTNPLPLVNHNGLELVTGNTVRVQGYPNTFHVYVYYE